MTKWVQQAATDRITRVTQLRSWTIHHWGCLQQSLLRLVKKPLSSLLTIGVLGVVLALPGGLYVLTKNMLALTKHWDVGTQITLFLSHHITDQRAEELAIDLQADPRLQEVTFMSREQALDEFILMTGFHDVLTGLPDNPLPAVIVLLPMPSLDAAGLSGLLDDLKSRPSVELAQLDLEWVQRLNGIVKIIQYSLFLMIGLLAIAMILVVGNTIRLEIENRRDEIAVTKLFGATHTFIRRPFLYDGLWFGFLGGVLACTLILLGLWLLNDPVRGLLDLYHSRFKPIYPDPLVMTGIVLLGGGLGYLGAWAAVTIKLHKIEP